MIALDTNILARFLVGDDAKQFEVARRRIAALGPAGDSGFVADVVLIELAWVLRSGYRLSRKEIGDALQSLASADNLTFENDDRLSRALGAFANGKGDFADYLIRERAREAGCASVLTFDRALLTEAGFEHPRRS